MIETLKPWFEVATPHEDICKGRLSEAVFAANIWAVAQKTAPEIYLDPEAFFSKTYITGGLKNVNIWAVAQKTAPEIYLDPEAFFSKTYITGGLKNVNIWAVAQKTAPEIY